MALMLALPVTTRAGEPFALAPGGDGVQRSPAAAHGGGVWLVVWQDGWSGDGGNSNIRGVLIGKGAVPGTPFTICGAAGNQELPRVAAAKDGK